MKTDLSQRNPFSTYSSNFARNFTFGDEFDQWVSAVMLPAITSEGDRGAKLRMADVGAGSCYWASRFLTELPRSHVVAVDPSEELLMAQASGVIADQPGVAERLERRCLSAQAFAKECDGDVYRGAFDCIYFMQSAHYISHSEFQDVFKSLARALKSDGGRIVIQARNMTPDWYPWAFPHEWRAKVEEALDATDMFYRANRYGLALRAMPKTFRFVEMTESSTEVQVDCTDYWQRLEDRWIPTFMSEEIIPRDLHRQGIDAMRARFEADGCKSVSWIEKFTLVTAYV
jgi:hypothetical protein